MKNFSGNGSTTELSGTMKFRRLFTIFLVAMIICSVYIISFHHYDGLLVRTDCPICKFIAVLSSGEKTVALQPVTSDFVHIFFIPENLIYVFGVITLVLGTRAPPFTAPHYISYLDELVAGIPGVSASSPYFETWSLAETAVACKIIMI
jgi:hypothetical protein